LGCRGREGTDLQAFAASDVGLVRSVNEDSYLVVAVGNPRRGVLCAVADGLGGYTGGDVASRTAVEVLREAVPERESDICWPSVLRRAFQEANCRIYRAGLRLLGVPGMGTTLTACAVLPGRAWVAHVGDSRAYLLDRNRILQLTQDHSVTAEMVRRGVLTPEQARWHSQRHILTRALGTEPEVRVDVTSREVKADEAVLLCTDGLCGLVEDPELHQVTLQAKDGQQACQQLVELAKRRGGFDNITVVLVEMPDFRAFGGR